MDALHEQPETVMRRGRAVTRHPQYLELPSPSNIRRSATAAAMSHHRHVWRLIVLLVAAAMCVIGTGLFNWEFSRSGR